SGSDGSALITSAPTNEPSLPRYADTGPPWVASTMIPASVTTGLIGRPPGVAVCHTTVPSGANRTTTRSSAAITLPSRVISGADVHAEPSSTAFDVHNRVPLAS